MKTPLQKLRERIDEINKDILDLLNIRTTLVKKLSAYKDEINLDYYDPIREQEMIKSLIEQNKGPLPNELVKDIFSCIFSSSLRFMGINKEKRLLVSREQNDEFYTISKMFNIPLNAPVIMAGPCAIETEEFLDTIADILCSRNVKFLRGGAYKPRTSPYDFQGLREKGLRILCDIGRKYELFTISEVVDTRDVEVAAKYVDIIQIGARNMQNYELLKEAGKTHKPVLIKRGMSATINEFINVAEYVALQGNRKIILCERGIRTFENKTRNTLDISSIPIIKNETKLPIIVDLSHSLGRKDIIIPMAKSALAAGADGLMIEVHPLPELALSDSNQQLSPEEFLELLDALV